MKYSIPAPLSHAYIIAGGSPASRREYADTLAAAYLCIGSSRPCGQCRHCVKVSRGIHPDLTVVTPPEGKREIVAEQARALRADAYIRPNEGDRKVYIIDPAEAMNPVAQNALLKVLEDGPAYTAFLLLSAQPGQLLETIRSRCETLTLPPEEEEQDPEISRRGEELAKLLLTGSEWDLARYLTGWELEKWKSQQVLEALSAAENALSPHLAKNRRAVPAIRALKSCRENAVYNIGAGHILGWLCAELFR